jgi:hypothetical protein
MFELAHFTLIWDITDGTGVGLSVKANNIFMVEVSLLLGCDVGSLGI